VAILAVMRGLGHGDAPIRRRKLHKGLQIEADLSILARQAQDPVEGITAFTEMRKPVFKGGNFCIASPGYL
jgi:hypothetical protein